MKLIVVSAASLAILGSTVLQASPSIVEPASSRGEERQVSDGGFWYVVSDSGATELSPTSVKGIVIPSTVEPTVETTATGAVLAWRRADGTRQSFVVQGVRSFTFKPGPLEGTTYIPFGRRLRYEAEDCCECASWNNMEESVEEFACVPGCAGCGCEACICTSLPCPGGLGGGLRMVPDADVTSSIAFDRAGPDHEIEFRNLDHGLARFRGDRLAAKLSRSGEILVENPDSISIPSAATSRRVLKGDDAIFGWSAPGVSVIVEQASRIPAPSFRDGTISFALPVGPELQSMGKVLEFDPDAYRCRVCGVHPNSDGDLDRMVCIPGASTCYRCVEFTCVAAGL